MAKYITMHTLACLTRQGAEELARRMMAATEVTARRVAVNMLEGKMLAEFEAASREALEAWLGREGMHFDFVLRIEYEARDGKLEPA